MSGSRITLEICIDSVTGALAAARGGADRLELCSALSEGGITPSYGLVQQVLTVCDLPVMMMIRCRGGGFVYSEEEIQVLLRDIQVAQSLGVQGVVVGALTEHHEIDMQTTRRLVEAAQPMEVTFHRAFDEPGVSAEATLDALHTLGVTRLLTSGQQASAVEGTSRIAELVKQSTGVSVMPGAGVRPENVASIIERTQAREIHGTFSRFCERLQRPVTCEATVRKARETLDALC